MKIKKAAQKRRGKNNMDPLQVYIICTCLTFCSFICGMLWNEAGHEVREEARANAERERAAAQEMLPGQRKHKNKMGA
jgi:hypothetical protein